jgi:hypothetical protein
MPRIASARLTLGSAVGLLLLSLPAVAMELPIDPAVGRYQRALRSVQSQAATNPDAAAREAAQLRRQMINENGGVNFTPDQARINRDLQAVEDMGRGDLDRPPTSPRTDDIQLPSTFENDSDDLPSMQRELRLTRRLLDRAAQGMDDQDPNQATSDLAAAETSITALRTAAPPADVQPLADRLQVLRRRLASLPPDDGMGSSLSPELRNAPTESPPPLGSDG